MCKTYTVLELIQLKFLICAVRFRPTFYCKTLNQNIVKTNHSTFLFINKKLGLRSLLFFSSDRQYHGGQ